MDPDILRYRLNALDFVNFANSLNAGDRPRVNFKQISSFILPPFSLAYQRRIVEKIDTLFARLDKGETALREVQTGLQRYRQFSRPPSPANSPATGASKTPTASTTAATCWPASSTPAAPTGKAAANTKNPPPPDTTDLPDLPEGWVWASVGQLLADIRYGTAQKCRNDTNGIAVLRIPNVAGGKVNLEDLKFTQLEDKQLAKLKLQKGDILIVRSNGSVDLVGRCAIVNAEAEGMAYAGYLIRLRFVSNATLSSYLQAVLHSPAIRATIQLHARSTSGVHNVNSSEVQSLPVPLPPLAEQQEIVDRFDAEVSRVEAAESACQTELARSQSLRQSILKDAFAGRLVPQDPNDEPASELLARIRAEREAAPPKRGRKAKAKS